eukprot:CAMPEP_0175479854 /NCGR_PEP_ID=MMETSP0095-20121207/77657_1 /TAXON_ID=311494 /ORGANISM="Alexandrium monilatum, Strain CCMP3105" /LENGTH=179 /DNA_ID=CAMNT_0016781485 /DNA_START=255 /DNA_END=792 /DNA_ORIENTATION=+
MREACLVQVDYHCAQLITQRYNGACDLPPFSVSESFQLQHQETRRGVDGDLLPRTDCLAAALALQPFFLSSLSGAVNNRRASSIESVASVMSRDKSMNLSKENELAAQSLLVQEHWETVKPPKTRLGDAVRSAFGAGDVPSSAPRFRRLPGKLRMNSWASSCIPKVNSAPRRGSQRATA